jgi:hypothetical protein
LACDGDIIAAYRRNKPGGTGASYPQLQGSIYRLTCDVPTHSGRCPGKPKLENL